MKIDDSVKRDIAKIAETAAKLLNEVQRMHRDVIIIKGRIQPFEGEDISKLDRLKHTKPKWNLRDALNMIAESRTQVEKMERAIYHIESMLTGIENDAISRAEMRPYLGRNRDE